MKKQIHGVEYEIKPIPPHLSPYSTRISELLQKKPQNVQEADVASDEIAACLGKLLAGTVNPVPPKEHQWQLFKILNDLTTKTLKDAGFFRKPKGSNTTKSGPPGAASP